MPVPSSLEESIEELYRVFARYLLPKDTQPCPCCSSPYADAQLRSQPLRMLGKEELTNYAFSALLTWGDEDTFKHFLPRLFQLLFEDGIEDSSWIDPSILFAKFRHGNWHLWPEEEKEAVIAFLRAVWSVVLEDPPDLDARDSLDTWLCAIAEAEDELTPYLDQWIQCEVNAGATLALWPMMTERYGPDAFWKDRPVQRDQVDRWLKSPQVLDKIIRSENLADPTLNQPANTEP